MTGKIIKDTEVVVLGGGIAGLSTVYCLSKLGRDVTLIEKNELISGASGANAAIVDLLWRQPGSDLKLGMASFELYDHLKKDLGYDIEFERCGMLCPIETETQIEEMKPFVEVRNKAGLADARLVDRDEMLELEPNLSPFLVGAVWNPIDGHLNPMFLSYAFAEEAKKLGAKIYQDTKVLAINLEKGRINSVVTDKGEIRTKYVVNACGIDAPAVGKMVGLEIPIVPNREQIIVTEEVPRIVRRVLLAAGYKKTVEDGTTWATVAFYANPQKKGNLLLGGVNDFAGQDRRTTFEALQTICKVAVKFLPILKTLRVHVIRSWAKFFIHTPDGKPILGKVDGIDGYLIAGGLNDYGIGVGPGVGKVISELICFGKSSIPIDEFNISRFN
jgi:sarcosine oxidase subunit beta